MNTTFSIIIPHKDIPDLLQRCLDSIPVRDDVEVIVVDDNSDPAKVDFRQFPRWEGQRYECHFTKEGKGAGHARNVGLDHACGRWVVFADADDFFSEDFNALLDEVAEAEADMVYFDYINVMSDDITCRVEERTWYSRSMASFRSGKISEASLKTSIPVVWCRFIKRDLIERHHVRFSETPWSNDVFFAAQTNCLAQSLQVSETIGYVLTQRQDSLTDNVCGTMLELRVRLEQGLKSEKMYESHGIHAKGSHTSPNLLTAYRKNGFLWCVWFGISNVGEWPVARLMFVFLAKRVKRREWPRQTLKTVL